MKLTFLGTGTSTGVPQIGCHCPVCTSPDPRDNRLRCSALLEVKGKSILIDCGPDFRQQMLRLDSPPIDALLVTHYHYDHVGGVDDLRPYTAAVNEFPIYCDESSARRFREVMPYSFSSHPYPGAPKLELKEILPYEKFFVTDKAIEVMPLSILHAPSFPILGFRIADFAYITDCKIMPELTLEHLKGVKNLVINALRHDEHPSHMNLLQALDVIKLVRPQQVWLTHFSHQIGFHANLERELPDGVHAAYDGLTVNV